MNVENFSPFPEFTFPSIDPDGRFVHTSVLRGTYEFNSGGELVFSALQSGPQLTDTYYGDPRNSSLRTEHDRVPLKSRGEIYFIDPISRSPKREPLDEWSVFIEVGPISKQLQVTGPRTIRPTLLGGVKLSHPGKCDAVSLTYENAYGGTDPNDICNFHNENPVGRGFLYSFSENHPYGPQLLDPLSGSLSTVGITPIHRGWSPRRELAGQFDDKWKKEKWPLYPDDFNHDFFQQSPAFLQLQHGYFKGNEGVRIHGIGVRENYEFRIPEFPSLVIVVVDELNGSAYSNFELDTIIFDLENEKIDLVWRASYFLPETAEFAAILIEESDNE